MRFHREIGKNLSTIVRLTHCHINDELMSHDISSGQFPYFMALIMKEGATQEELSEILFMDKGTTAKALKKLEENGFIIRKKCQTDKRCNRVFFTEKGRSLIPEVMRVLRTWSDKMFKGFSMEERELLGEHLDRMMKNIIDLRDK